MGGVKDQDNSSPECVLKEEIVFVGTCFQKNSK